MPSADRSPIKDQENMQFDQPAGLQIAELVGWSEDRAVRYPRGRVVIVCDLGGGLVDVLIFTHYWPVSEERGVLQES